MDGGVTPMTGAQSLVEDSIATSERANHLLTRATRLRSLLGIALLFLALGCAPGYVVGLAIAPRPPLPGPAVTRYMAGVQRLDGTEVWASLSPDLQAEKIRGGDSPAAF